MLIQFKRAYFWWETQKTYKLGEIIEVDKYQYRELVSKGIVEDYITPSKQEKENLEGNTLVCFKKSVNEFKCGEIVELDANEARELIEKGYANVYSVPPAKEEEIPEGLATIQYLKSTESHKCGDIDTIDAGAANSLIKKGYAMAAKEEDEKRKLLKSISKMNRNELIAFAKEKGIDTFNYKNKELIKRSIIIALNEVI